MVTQAGAMVVNFVVVLSIVYSVEIQYKKQFDHNREWMRDLTMLLYKAAVPNRASVASNDVLLRNSQILLESADMSASTV